MLCALPVAYWFCLRVLSSGHSVFLPKVISMPNNNFRLGSVRTSICSSSNMSNFPVTALNSAVPATCNCSLIFSSSKLFCSLLYLISILIADQQSVSALTSSIRWIDSVILGQQLAIVVCVALIATRRRLGCDGPKGSVRIFDNMGIMSCTRTQKEVGIRTICD